MSNKKKAMPQEGEKSEYNPNQLSFEFMTNGQARVVKDLLDIDTGEVRRVSAIKTALTAPLYRQRLEKNLDPSLTVPDQTMTVLEMLKRHRAGLPLDSTKGAVYSGGDEPLADLSKMDLIDRQAYLDSVADKLVEVKARLEEAAKTKAEKDFLRKVDEEVKKELAKLRSAKDRNDITDIDSDPAPQA